MSDARFPRHLSHTPQSPRAASRREFLAKSCQWTSAVLLPVKPGRWSLFLPAGVREPVASSPFAPTEYRLTPHYRLRSPLKDILRYVHPGLDGFLTEEYSEELGAVLAKWTQGLRESPPNTQPISIVLSPRLQASSLRPSQREPLRRGAALEVYRNRFAGQPALGAREFISDLTAWLSAFARLDTAEFLISGISLSAASSAPRVQVRVRYDLVGSGAQFFRGERVGHWNLEWERTDDGHWSIVRWTTTEETESRASGPVFVDISEAALGANASYREQMLHGTDYWRARLDASSRIDVYGHNGVAVGDCDSDGFDDVYVCQPSGIPNRLYRNRGDGTFEDVTEAAGVGVLDNTACALFADLENNGHQDLIVVRVEGPLLFRNQGGGRYHLQPDAFRFARSPQGSFTGAALADYDRDGRPDLYFCLYSYYQGLNQYQSPTPVYDARNGPPNFLLHNNTDGTFEDVTEASGMNHNNDRYSFACGWGDYNDDGWPDLYVANDFGRKNLYRNNGNGTFTDVADDTGVEDVGAGMSVCWLDYDNDGRPDLYVADMWSAAGERVSAQDEFMRGAPKEARALVRKHARGNSLFRNRGDGRFEDASSTAGVEMGRWSWSSDAWDFDHDGYSDLYIANGMISGPDSYDLASFFWRQVVTRTPLAAAPAPAYERAWNAINQLIRSGGTWAGYERNTFYANNRDGTFADVSGAVGLDFIEDSRSFALADFDHDGRLELFLKNRNAPQVRVLKNVMRSLGGSIALRLRGSKGNRDSIGARVTLEAGGLRQVRFLQAGSGFLSQHTKEMFFGLGAEKGPVTVTVRWPGGTTQRFDNLPVEHRIELEEGVADFRAEPFRAAPSGFAPSSFDGDSKVAATGSYSDALPSPLETWMLAPVLAPDFSLPDLGGRTQTLAGFRGAPLLMTLWATWSPPSQQQLRLLDEYQRRRTAARLNLLAINVDAAGETETVRAAARAQRFTLPVLLASEDIAATYNILYRYLFDRQQDCPIPTTFFLDARGFIVKVYQGVVSPERFAEDFRRIPTSRAGRMKRALPFPGDWYGGDFQRNELTYAAAFLERGYLDAAASSCRRVLAGAPESAEAYYLLGSIALQQKSPAQARVNFERALKLQPGYSDTWPNAWNNLGLLSIEEKHPDEAVRDFQQALRLNPGHAVALENLGNLYRQQGRWAEAQSALERAVQLNPDDPEANYSLAMVFAGQDSTARAEPLLERALALRPGYPEALNNLGILYARTGRLAQAIATFEKCIHSTPDFDQAYLNLARAYVAEGDRKNARDALHELLVRHPNHAAAQRALQEIEGDSK